MGKTVLVNYFAYFREQRGLSSERCCTESATLAELYDELQLKHGFKIQRRNLLVARNDEFCAWETPLNSEDEIAFIPPVAGG